MDIKAEVDIKLPGFEALGAIPPTNPHIVRLMKRMAVLYREFAQRRFRANAHGGGEWPDLKPSTKAARDRKTRHVSQATKDRLESIRAARRAAGVNVVPSGSYAILIDTGVMVKGLDAVLNTSAGAIEQVGDFSVTVGYGGTTNHPQGGPSIHDLVVWHQEGGGSRPPRKIMPMASDLSGAVLDQMRDEATATLKAIAGGAGNG